MQIFNQPIMWQQLNAYKAFADLGGQEVQDVLFFRPNGEEM